MMTRVKFLSDAAADEAATFFRSLGVSVERKTFGAVELRGDDAAEALLAYKAWEGRRPIWAIVR